MDLWLQLWLQEAAPGSPSSNLEKTGRRVLEKEIGERNIFERNKKINANIK